MVERELHQIVAFLPGIRWIRFVRIDGLGDETYLYDAPDYQHDNSYDQEDWHKSAMSAASMSLTERISRDLVLGRAKIVVLSSTEATYFQLPVGETEDWTISFVVNGHPPIDSTLKYFKDRQYLANILPFLEAK